MQLIAARARFLLLGDTVLSFLRCRPCDSPFCTTHLHSIHRLLCASAFDPWIAALNDSENELDCAQACKVVNASGVSAR
eukprot:COSAG02_NODE_936_length_15800_cov_56.762945_3_plen_79_part_00